MYSKGEERERIHYNQGEFTKSWLYPSLSNKHQILGTKLQWNPKVNKNLVERKERLKPLEHVRLSRKEKKNQLKNASIPCPPVWRERAESSARNM